jgi:hypothetical protein
MKLCNSRLRAGVIAALLALIPVSSHDRTPRSHTSVASGGVVGRPLAPRAPERERVKAEVRRRLAERASGTYIGEMLAERDSALARWPDRRGKPLTVWIQWAHTVRDWSESYHDGVRDAVREWDELALPVRFAFTGDSTRADVHVTFVDHFDEPISGRTKWARDDDWWITDADIVLAVHHSGGAALDVDAMRAMALHELGHLLGLDHTEDPTSVMAPKVRVRSLSAADLATVRLLYTLPPGGVR